LGTIYNNTYSSNKEWKPAAALMAGFSYDITQNLKLDAGYKFTYISGGDASNNLPSGGGFANLKYDSFNIHQVRIGLRYEIW
jgi:opacity protein-like surface antigen